MYYVIWFDDNIAMTANTCAAYTSNIVYAKHYLMWMSKVVLKSEGHLYEVRTLEEVKKILIDRGDVSESDDLGDYQLTMITSQTRPNCYTLVTSSFWSNILDFMYYNGNPNIYGISKFIARMQVEMNIMLKNTPMAMVLAAGINRMSQYLYAYGVVEEHLSAIVEGDYDEGEYETISDAIEETNIPLFDVVDTIDGYYLIDTIEYINMYEFDGHLFITGGMNVE